MPTNLFNAIVYKVQGINVIGKIIIKCTVKGLERYIAEYLS